MRTYEVRFMEADGTVTSTFFTAENAEALYEYLSDVCPDATVIGYTLVGG